MKSQRIRRRTLARELAMQLLYERDLCGIPPSGDLVEDYDQRLEELSKGDAEVAKFIDRLVRGTLDHQQEIDRTLQGVARNWEIRRMAVVDRNILRMAVFELTWCADIPAKVSINEAIELGKKFSTANSGGFANGILDRIRIDLDAAANARAEPQPAEAASAAPPPLDDDENGDENGDDPQGGVPGRPPTDPLGPGDPTEL